MGTLYDKTGAAFSLDHEHEGVAYVRPMVKTVFQAGHGDDLHESEDYAPAAYLIAIERDALFDAPPVAAVNEEIASKRAEIDALKSDAKRLVREINSQRIDAERQLQSAKRQLDDWMRTHRVMLDLGKLLDGQVLYPLSVQDNPYHHGRGIPRIPDMRSAAYLAVTNVNFEAGQPWSCNRYGHDHYGVPFQFFDTEEERAAVIQEEFDTTCQRFREKPDFDTTDYTTNTTLHYGTLIKWVKVHPALSIPKDIVASKADHDAILVERRKAKLAAELAEIDARAALAQEGE